MYDNDELAPCATVSEAISEWARNVGWHDRYKDSQYLLTDYDTWVINPHYTGPQQPHPEDDYADEWEEAERSERAEWEAAAKRHEEDERFYAQGNRTEQEAYNEEMAREIANEPDDLPW